LAYYQVLFHRWLGRIRGWDDNPSEPEFFDAEVTELSAYGVASEPFVDFTDVAAIEVAIACGTDAEEGEFIGEVWMISANDAGGVEGAITEVGFEEVREFG